MRKEAYENGRKLRYNHTVDDDGYDVISEVVFDDTVTVINGVEHTIKENAPKPVMYGVKVAILALHEGAGERATYDTYNYITGKYRMGIAVPRRMVLDKRGPYQPPDEKTRLRKLADGKPDLSWHKNDYQRDIDLSVELDNTNTFPNYNYRPIEDNDTIQ